MAILIVWLFFSIHTENLGTFYISADPVELWLLEEYPPLPLSSTFALQLPWQFPSWLVRDIPRSLQKLGWMTFLCPPVTSYPWACHSTEFGMCYGMWFPVHLSVFASLTTTIPVPKRQGLHLVFHSSPKSPVRPYKIFNRCVLNGREGEKGVKKEERREWGTGERQERREEERKERRKEGEKLRQARVRRRGREEERWSGEKEGEGKERGGEKRGEEKGKGMEAWRKGGWKEREENKKGW